MCWKGTTRWLYFSRSNHVSWLAACELQKNIPEWYADFFPFPPAWSGKLKKSPFRPQDNISAQKSRNKAIFKLSDGEDVGFFLVCVLVVLLIFSHCIIFRLVTACINTLDFFDGHWQLKDQLHTLHSHPINTTTEENDIHILKKIFALPPWWHFPSLSDDAFQWWLQNDLANIFCRRVLW